MKRAGQTKTQTSVDRAINLCAVDARVKPCQAVTSSARRSGKPALVPATNRRAPATHLHRAPGEPACWTTREQTKHQKTTMRIQKEKERRDWVKTGRSPLAHSAAPDARCGRAGRLERRPSTLSKRKTSHYKHSQSSL